MPRITVTVDYDVTAPQQGLAAAIASDTFGTHDAIPRGVPAGYSWRLDADTNPQRASYGFQSYGAVNTWGQVFAPVGGSHNYNVRLQARDPRIYFFDGNQWTRATLTAGSMGGAFYRGDFQSSTSGSTPTKDAAGTYSEPLSLIGRGTYDAWHFWWNGMYPRIAIPSGCQGILTRTDMRLIPAAGYTGVAGAKFIATSCCDLFATPRTTTGPGGMNDGIPEGRMKWVTGDWQPFYDTTVTLATLNSHAPVITD